MTHSIGTLGRGVVAHVGPHGDVRPVGERWRLEWWVGGEDRWHLPEHDAAVRQRRLAGTPVVETAMRVPGGDAVQRIYAAVGPGDEGDAVVVEIANETPVPFAVAFAVRGDGAAEVPLRFSRPPSRHAVTDDVAVHVLPVAHRTAVRVLVGAPDQAEPGRFPSADQVAAGWRAQVDRGMRVVLPDEARSDALVGRRIDLLLRSRQAAFDELDTAHIAALVTELDREGFAPEAADLLAVLADRQRLNGTFARGPRRDETTAAAVEAFVTHWALTHDRLGLEAHVGTVAKAATRLARRGRPVPGVAALLDGVDQPEAADRLRAAEGASEAQPGPAGAEPALVLPVDHATLALLPDVPPTWLGQGVEVHDAPTPHGPISFAIRWHGERPALLWDLAAWADAGPVTLTAPGLDPTWSSTERRGDALLAAPTVGASS